MGRPSLPRSGRCDPPTRAACQRLHQRRYRYRGVIDEVAKAQNRTKSKVRAKVEHSIGVIKRIFGFTKVRYRGLDKNAPRLFVTAALANLFIVRGRLHGA